MPKRRKQKVYSGEFKLNVIETMRRDNLGYHETARMFDVASHKSIISWEHIYLEHGSEGLKKDNRGLACEETGTRKGPAPRKNKNEDYISELQRLRAENAYLKKLNALVAEREQREKKLK